MPANQIRKFSLLVGLSGYLTLCSSAQVTFQERSAAVGLLHHTTGGFDRVGLHTTVTDWAQTGAAIGDMNGDGLPDVIACGRLEATHLFVNTGAGFVDATVGSGLETDALDTCVTLGDIDNDGDLDVFIGVQSPFEGGVTSHDRLLRNDGLGRFKETSGMIDTSGGGHTLFAKFFDLDYDGDLDLYSCQFNGTPNQLFINDGGGTFRERGAQLGANIGGSSHVAGIADMDGDNIVDILVGCDRAVSVVAGFTSNSGDVFLHGVGDGSFVDKTIGAAFDPLTGMGATTMGLTLGDVNYDGLLDVFRTEYGSQILSINHGWPGGGVFTDEQVAYGVESAQVPVKAIPGTMGPTVGWGAKLMNVDHDLWLDLFEVTGNITANSPRDQRSFLYMGEGPSMQFSFKDETLPAGLYEEIDDRGLCVGDLDSDGDLDIIVMPASGALRYHENSASSTSEGWLQVEAKTFTSAPGGFGTQVSFVDSLGYPHLVSIGTGGSTASHNEAIAHFGLGLETSVDLKVRFPSGMTIRLPGTVPNQRLVVIEPEMLRLSGTRLRSVQAGNPESLIVTAAAFDKTGNPLPASANVIIEIPGLVAFGPVVSLSGNLFSRRFAAPATPGVFRVHAAFNGWRPLVRPSITYLGPVSPGRTTKSVSPMCVRAGSSDTFKVTLTPRDAGGVVIGPGLSVFADMPISAGIPRTQMKDMGDGSYLVKFPAPIASGLFDIQFTVFSSGQKVLLTSEAQIESALTASPSRSELYQEQPNPAFSSLPNQLKLRFTPRDGLGMRLGPGGVRSLVITPSPGSAAVIERVDLRALHDEGAFDFVLERDPVTPSFSGMGQFSFFYDGILVSRDSYHF